MGSEPTKHARDAATWAEVCPATDYETGQLLGRVGTPEEPLFTYEQAVHHRRGRDNLLLVVGADIPTKERDRLSEATITELTKKQTDVEAHRLPRLPRGVVPKGWDGWGRPWALIDCPTDKVPPIASQHGGKRVTVTALVNFPPEPFYLPDATALDYALRYCSKAGKEGTLTCGLTLGPDGQWKDPAGTYKKLSFQPTNIVCRCRSCCAVTTGQPSRKDGGATGPTLQFQRGMCALQEPSPESPLDSMSSSYHWSQPQGVLSFPGV